MQSIAKSIATLAIDVVVAFVRKYLLVNKMVTIITSNGCHAQMWCHHITCDVTTRGQTTSFCTSLIPRMFLHVVVTHTIIDSLWSRAIGYTLHGPIFAMTSPHHPPWLVPPFHHNCIYGQVSVFSMHTWFLGCYRTCPHAASVCLSCSSIQLPFFIFF